MTLEQNSNRDTRTSSIDGTFIIEYEQVFAVRVSKNFQNCRLVQYLMGFSIDIDKIHFKGTKQQQRQLTQN